MFLDCRTGRGAEERKRERGRGLEGRKQREEEGEEKEGSDLIPPKGTPL